MLGWLVLPWTILMWVAVAIGGGHGIGWLWIALGVLAGVASYTGGGWRNRNQMSTYTSR